MIVLLASLPFSTSTINLWEGMVIQTIAGNFSRCRGSAPARRNPRA
jgi:hypothetical protein